MGTAPWSANARQASTSHPCSVTPSSDTIMPSPTTDSGVLDVKAGSQGSSQSTGKRLLHLDVSDGPHLMKKARTTPPREATVRKK